MKTHIVYILQSTVMANRFYTGYTENIERRLLEHNAGKCISSAKYAPWKIKTAVHFVDGERAIAFEKYLKTASGRAFAKKRL